MPRLALILGFIMLSGRPVAGNPPEGLSEQDWSGIKEAHAKWRHSFQQDDDAWTARNPRQQWLARFDSRGFTAIPDGQTWKWGLELKSYGFSGSEVRMTGGAPSRVENGRLVRDWDAVLQEWHINDARGLEHGFVVREAPAPGVLPDDLLHFRLAVRGSLSSRVSADGRDVVFEDEFAVARVRYSGLKVWDAAGRILEASFCREPGGGLRLTVDAAGACYPLTVDPIAQQARLKAASPGAGDRFGDSVAIYESRVLVGAPREDGGTTGASGPANRDRNNSGAAHVFVRTGGVWVQEAYLKAFPHIAPGAQFGSSVAIGENLLVVGAPFRNLAGASYIEEFGAAYVFRRGQNGWSPLVTLLPNHRQGVQNFGASVAMDGSGRIVVGAPGEGSSSTGVNSTPNQAAFRAGAAYVFSVSSGTGTATQQAYLKASNTGEGDRFGSSVAVSGDTIVVGAPREDSGTSGVNPQSNEDGADSGAAYVFFRGSGGWQQQAWLKASNAGAGHRFGTAVGVSDDTIVVGAPWENSAAGGINPLPNTGAENAGAAYVFRRSVGNWSQAVYLKAPQPHPGDEFGRAVGVFSTAPHANKVVVGAPGEDSSGTGVNPPTDKNATDSGAIYVYGQQSHGAWTRLATLKPAAVAAGDAFGSAVGIFREYVVAGAPLEDTGPDDTVLLNSGAVSVFNLDEPYPEPKLRVTAFPPQRLALAVNNGSQMTFPESSISRTVEVNFNLDNLGAPDLVFDGDPAVQLSGASTDDFEVVQPAKTRLSSPEFGINESGTRFTLRFAPQTVGLKQVTVTIPNNTPDSSPFVFHVTSFALVANPTPVRLTGLTQTYDGTPRPVGFEGGNGKPVTIQYIISSVASAEPPVNAGEYPVVHRQGTELPRSETLTILQAPLLVQPDPQRRLVGQPNPPLTVSYSGFAPGDDADNAIDTTPLVTTRAGLRTLGGRYRITSAGGSAANYALTHQPGELVVETFAGSYQTLLLEAGTARMAGFLEIRVSPDSQSFTGRLSLTETRSVIRLNGALRIDPEAETASGAVILADDAGVLAILLALNHGFAATLSRGGVAFATGEGRRRLVLGQQEKVPHRGRHTVLLTPVSPPPDSPLGQGWASALVNARGMLRLAGRLPDGTAFARSLAPDDGENPGFRLFLRPWAPARTPAFVAGFFSLLPNPALEGRRWVPPASPATLLWTKTGHRRDTSYRQGFSGLSLELILVPWQPPVRAGNGTIGVTLGERLGLDLDGRILPLHERMQSAELPDLPAISFLTQPGNSLRLPPGEPNPSLWRLAVRPASGVFHGRFQVMFEGRKTNVRMSGAMLQPSPGADDLIIGGGHILFPCRTDQGDRELRSGLIRLDRFDLID